MKQVILFTGADKYIPIRPKHALSKREDLLLRLMIRNRNGISTLDRPDISIV
ncbi:MAG: hypothetical protein IE884_00465 [Sulfuricurvum sp.]|nr:hypothetical protein [Sulfuricurvum sp.]